MVWASQGVNEGRKRNFIRIGFWFALSAPFWIAGAMAEAWLRIACWTVAIMIEYAAPFRLFRTPGMGRSTAGDWDISGGHMAERCALFIIIALGEAVLVTGATFASLPHDPPTVWAFVASFLGSAAMWQIYFDIGAKRASSLISRSDNAGFIARNAYTYLHMPIVAGVVVTAVADAKMLASPLATADMSFVLTACGGPALFLFGNQMFKWVTNDQRYPPLSHFIGMILLGALGVAGLAGDWNTLAIGALATLALAFAAQWEWYSLNGGWRRWAPWMGKLFSRGT